MKISFYQVQELQTQLKKVEEDLKLAIQQKNFYRNFYDRYQVKISDDND